MPRRHPAKPAAARLGSAVPILRVRDLTSSIDHYVGILGFKLDWKDEGIIASVSRERCSVLLCEGDQGNAGGWVWIGADDILPLCEELRAKGAHIRQGPTNHPWAYEMQVEDPDGNVLRFGSDSRIGEPFGPWCDADGELWAKRPHGARERVNRP